MINGNAKEFIEGLNYGDERFFLYNGNKYFIQGHFENKKPMLELYILEPSNTDFEWRAFSDDKTTLSRNLKTQEFSMAEHFGKLSGWMTKVAS